MNGCINRWIDGSQKLTKCTTLHITMMTRITEMSRNSAMPKEDPIVVVSPIYVDREADCVMHDQ
jgi:hypothetical protein